jgi:FkbM family methyltransferase
MTYSIIIPTYNHCEDFLKPCLESIFRYTDLSDVEIIISANGCIDNTKAYVDSLPYNVKLVWSDTATGYTKATNDGIKVATGDYIILMNNDVVLLPQETNTWLHMLCNPFIDGKVGITGPMKFSWDCGGIQYDGMAFWLVAIRKEVFASIGILDEIYSPGMGEDGDFCIRATSSGYTLVSVPNDVKTAFGAGPGHDAFPIYHAGNGTFADDERLKNDIIERNNKILANKYGKKKYSIVIPTYNHCDDLLKPCIESIIEHTDLDNTEIIVVANGCEDNTHIYVSSLGDLAKLIWVDDAIGYTKATNIGIQAARGEYIILLNNDTMFLSQEKNTWIRLLEAPFINPKMGITGVLENYDPYADAKFLVFFCVMIPKKLFNEIGILDEIFSPGYGEDIDFSLRAAKAGYSYKSVDSFIYVNGNTHTTYPIWHKNNKTFGEISEYSTKIVVRNSAILAQRYGKKMKKYSVVIPTYNHCDDLLKPLVDSIIKYTNLDNIEFIIVANGCTDNTKAYVESLGAPFKLVWSTDAIGYTKATNLGIKECNSEFVILLNNDTELLSQTKNDWLKILGAPFADEKVGMVGPLEMFDRYSNHHVLIFFCVMIRKKLFDELGLLDEIYSPGGGEDIDFTIRAQKAGWKTMPTSIPTYTASVKTNVGDFPIWHKDNQTFRDIPEYTKSIIKVNGLLNCKRYNDNIKLNLGAGGIDYDGFLSVDMYDKRSNIPMDITKLDFDDNTVVEIMASHVFEHLNPYHSVAILQEWLRVLKPGGKLAMEMPDIEALCKSFLAEKDYYKKMGILNAVYGSVNTTDVGGPDEITSPHLFGWWPESLFNHLQAAGYIDITFHPEKWPHPCDNLRVEAYKPSITIDKDNLKAQEPNTYHEIFEQNTYGVETAEVRGKTVIDIGANLGMFSLSCLSRGATKLIAIEAQPTVYNLGMLNNIAPYPAIIPLNYAASDVDGAIVHIPNAHVASRVGGTDGDAVETITLATVLDRYNIIGDDLVMKIDCEGSEFNILLPAPTELLRRFNIIYMEVHANTNENPAYHDVKLIENKMIASGFNLAKRFTYYSYNEKGESFHIGVYVEKWVRV